MSEESASPRPGAPEPQRLPDFQRLVPQSSMGLKLLLVCFLALVMAIPAGFVWALIASRANDASAAVSEVASMRGGPQTLGGPMLVIPYDRDVAVQNGVQTITGYILVHPETGTGSTTLTSELLKRGLQQVPVYAAQTDFTASFNAERATASTPPAARLRWKDAAIYMVMSDLVGAKEATLVAGGEPVELSPFQGAEIVSGSGGNLTYQRLIGGPAPWLEDPARRTFDVTARARITGAQRIALAPFARDTTLSVNGSGPGAVPSFDGGASPETRNVTETGFSATWRIPYLARGAAGAGADLNADMFLNSAPGVTLINAASPYRAVERALKYAPMFLGLVFLTYFLFETRVERRAHPAQYILVGLAQLVFYLLLLAISEIAGFNGGFLIAATATVLTISLYAGSVFRSWRTAGVAFGVFSALYGLIWVLMRMEDYALLAGSVASFLAIAATMWMTRNLDWYGSARGARAAPRA